MLHLIACVFPMLLGGQPAALDLITFHDGKALYLPLREAASALGIVVGYEYEKRQVLLDARVHEVTEPLLFDRTKLIDITRLEAHGVQIAWDGETSTGSLTKGGHVVPIVLNSKRVLVDKTTQQLTAWQGERVVMTTNVSTGRYDSSTPVGTWTAKTRERMHYSRIYDNSPMPYAIQVVGNIFLHGYHSVPKYPASHGCVRIPVRGRNSAAKWLYSWIEIGTPVTIEGKWAGGRSSTSAKRRIGSQKRIAVKTGR